MNGYFNFPPYTGMQPMNYIPTMSRAAVQAPSIGRGLSNLFRGGAAATGLNSAANVGAVGSTAAKTGFTFSGLLNGASKTLGVINQAIPVFYQVKPIWNNAKTMFRVMREVNKNDTQTTKQTTTNQPTNQETNQTNNNQNGPTFFA